MLLSRVLAITVALILGIQTQDAFDLDAPGGTFEYWRITDTGPATGIETTLEIRDVRRDSRWGAVFTLQANDAGTDETERYAGIQIYADGRDLKTRVITGKGEQAPTRQNVALTVERRKPFSAILDWSAEGVLKIGIDGRSVEVPLDFKVRGFAVATSTGRLIAHSLRILGPPR
jgi:hypothetical protein